MAKYSWVCESCGERKETRGSMHVSYWVVCDFCFHPMRRVWKAAKIQPAYSASALLTDWMIVNSNLERSGRKERFSPDLVTRPEGVPGKDYRFR